MDKSIYTAMSGAVRTLTAQSTVSNNLANASTVGFRAELAMATTAPVDGDGLPTRVASTFGGAAGGSFRAQELYAAVRECSWGSACAIRERETALHVVRWLVGLRLVQVVSEE